MPCSSRERPRTRVASGADAPVPNIAHEGAVAVADAEDVLVQQMIWPARCWRIVVGRESGVVDPYWRQPPEDADRILSISTGSRITRAGFSAPLGEIAMRMLEAVGGDMLAVDVLETDSDVYALEINHNFDAHGGDAPAAHAFRQEISRKVGVQVG